MKIAFLIILYNKEILDSSTVVTLSKFIKENEIEHKIILWNNGPHAIKKLDLGFEYEIKQDLTNRPLSFIYNLFISHNDADKYVFLDDDTQITEDYFSKISKRSFDLLVPDIIVGHQKLYPVKFKKYSSNFVSIGSGICCSRGLCTKLKDEFGKAFDERFLFYGVDTTFFYRVNTISDIQIINEGTLIHSLSRLDINEKNNSFRLYERCVDIALQNRYYFSRRTFRSGIKFLIMMVLKQDFIYIKTFFGVLIKGCHPKSKGLK